MFGLGFQELLIVGIIALLLFGKRLPEVAKSLGQSYREFRKGLSDIQSSFNYDSFTSSSSYSSSSALPSSSDTQDDYDDHDEPTAPKFELPPSATQATRDDELPTGEIPKPIEEK